MTFQGPTEVDSVGDGSVILVDKAFNLLSLSLVNLHP